METLLVRLKPYNPRRGHVLRRYTYRGIKFHWERGWYRVAKAIAEYLRSVRQVPGDEHAPPAFDVCTDEEAKKLVSKEKDQAAADAEDEIRISEARGEGTVTTEDLPDASDSESSSKGNQSKGRRR